ncbi:hypothetical protein J5U18_04670 [Sphingobacteriaceae bacterium WQ 2009]|uniref:DUF6965 domain-containing protein n=1 Tax=Rhinopithecimicrobium faecis TaxID=2820698 RepID=A0A8T4H747_9SPHI|nr:hypothetical protein [Sphingobacteriaceae bacterium WQ 2009]
MTIEELKAELTNKSYPEEVRIAVDMVVTNVPHFLSASFAAAERWTKDLEKCPAWLRLQKFKEAVAALEG